MKLRTLALVLLAFITSSTNAQLQSPDEFLGYSLGSKFTPHYKIVNYFNAVAAAMPGMMRLEKYGETTEGRPLLIAIVSSSANFSRIDEIRKNNLRLAGILNDKPADLNAPSIVWLSYNVHGNEASSSETSMKTLYELLNPSNAQTKEWLSHVVVIIDPCLNPDGRDRYVNWYNQMLGANPNSNPDAREHNEPWPGGRFNHYNFDLNRDWAWQTQTETQLRIAKYNQWLPQIHCDFHEQEPNNTYYFAPAAEPFHEWITPWQREFQTTIGKNHAKYFDQNGWLFFTREIFDLFYPSYGDTYPTMNGAIGMTYEQAGHSRGGLAYLRTDGDTLTLKDRIEHHFTTGMSTIEITAKNTDKLISEYKKFFDMARSKGVGENKSFVVTSNNLNKLNALKELLDRNQIVYGYTVPGSKGDNYFTGREESVQLESNYITINGLQPKSALLQVLFEPRSKLSDSVTYDITAWSLPYAFGLKTYAFKEPLGVMQPLPRTARGSVTSNYGYVVTYSSFSDAKLMAALLQRGIRVRFAENDFMIKGKRYQKGSLLILRSGNERSFSSIATLLADFHANADPVESGYMESGFDFGSEKVHFVRKPVVALLTGNNVSPTAAGEVWNIFDQQLNYPITLINADDISSVSWKNIDVLIIPDGYYKFLGEKDGSADLKSWVKQGGKIIAMESAASTMAGNDWGFKLKKAEEEDTSKNSLIKKYGDRERDGIVNNIPGAIYKVDLDNSHPLAFGYPDLYYTLKQNGSLYEYMKDGWNVGVIKRDKPVAGFVGSKMMEHVKEGTVIGVVPMGNGSIIYFADDPVFRNFWENGKLLLCNAVFLVGQ